MRVRVCLVALSLVLAGCQSETGSERATKKPTRAASGTFPVTITAANGRVTIPRRPRRIVSLSPTATEMLFAIGAGEQVVAVDDQSNYPPSAPRTNLSGLQPNAEAIAGHDADLVVSSAGGELAKSLGAVKIPLLVQPAAASLADIYGQIEQLGAATGNLSNAARLVGSMRLEMARIRESAPELDNPPTYYHELDTGYFTVTSKTFIGDVYGLFGLRNIADAADKGGGGYPQLSAEYIIQADPDLIFLADTKCCKQSAATVAERPGWNEITAVRTGGVVELDDDVASRWGPRVVELARVVARKLAALQPAGA